MLEFKNLSKSFHENKVLDHINLKFSRRFISYFKAELGGRRRVLLSAVWNETDSDRGDEYNGLNIILLSLAKPFVFTSDHLPLMASRTT